MAFITEGEISILDKNDITTVGGFDFSEFIDELSSEQKCPICLFAMRSPVQTVCGHRFCESCFIRTPISENPFSENGDPVHVCPQDRQPISQNGGWFYDKAWERGILSLRVRCKKRDRGCGWTGEIRNWQEHSKVCQYEDVICEKCYQYIQRVSLDLHTTSECSSRIVICKYCKEEFEFWEKEVWLLNND